jgi:hypothetical protein
MPKLQLHQFSKIAKQLAISVAPFHCLTQPPRDSHQDGLRMEDRRHHVRPISSSHSLTRSRPDTNIYHAVTTDTSQSQPEQSAGR